MLSLQHLYDSYEAGHRPAEPTRMLSAIEQFCKRRKVCKGMTAFERIAQCRRGLEALDRQGWERSYHQRQFHEQFIRACARIFYKTEAPGTFQRDHQRLLQLNGWKNLSQEILISTPRRFGKTISVSLFAAAILYSAPRVEMSIYSTCKRISQKLLRNVKKFLDLIYLELDVQPYRIIRSNCEVRRQRDFHRRRRLTRHAGAHDPGTGVEARRQDGEQLPFQGNLPNREPFREGVRVIRVDVKHFRDAVHRDERAHHPYLSVGGVRVKGSGFLDRPLQYAIHRVPFVREHVDQARRVGPL
jgi:hypothetical protein